MCCSTGVCGTDVDPTLPRFAADVDWLEHQGVAVDRATLSQEPVKFVTNDLVREALQTEGADVLPMVLVDGVVRSKGRYPNGDELAEWTGVAKRATPALFLMPEPATSAPVPVPGVTGLDVVNIDPSAAAAEYRERVVGPYRGVLPDDAVASIEEELSGSCTVEAAAFNEFVTMLTNPEIAA